MSRVGGGFAFKPNNLEDKMSVDSDGNIRLKPDVDIVDADGFIYVPAPAPGQEFEDDFQFFLDVEGDGTDIRTISGKWVLETVGTPTIGHDAYPIANRFPGSNGYGELFLNCTTQNDEARLYPVAYTIDNRTVPAPFEAVFRLKMTASDVGDYAFAGLFPSTSAPAFDETDEGAAYLYMENGALELRYADLTTLTQVPLNFDPSAYFWFRITAGEGGTPIQAWGSADGEVWEAVGPAHVPLNPAIRRAMQFGGVHPSAGGSATVHLDYIRARFLPGYGKRTGDVLTV